jgi:phosphatidylinositol glycan class M
MTKTRAAIYTAVWAGIQALWLSGAYSLEFLGQNVFVSLWIRSLVYVIGNCWIISGIMDSYEVDGNSRDVKVETDVQSRSL